MFLLIFYREAYKSMLLVWIFSVRAPSVVRIFAYAKLKISYGVVSVREGKSQSPCFWHSQMFSHPSSGKIRILVFGHS